MPKFVVNFTEVGKEDLGLVGGKGANLGEMTQAGVPVPPGFIVTSEAYYHFLDQNNLRVQIKSLLKNLNVSNPEALDIAAGKVKKLIIKSPIPKNVSDPIIHHYLKLGSRFKMAAVAVRSSATAEDLPDASFAGQQESYLNILGESNVIEKVRACWASLFGARAIFYREEKNFDHFKIGIAVPVQKMVQSEISGVMFTVDPIFGHHDYAVIEAGWGLGDYIVQGVVTPDHYEVYKPEMRVVRKVVNPQKIMEVRSTNEVKRVSVPKSREQKPKLTDPQIIELAKIGQKIHDHYFFPQDIEWAYAKGKFHITQTRPITTLKQTQKNVIPESSLEKLPLLLTGSPASPGISSGPAKILKSAKEIHKIAPGDVLVAHMTSPDYVPAMRKATAIVTDAGGQTSHAAIVSRELGVSCVVGTDTATKVLKDGVVITVNGTTGEVFKGAPIKSQTKISIAKTLPPPKENLKTATRLYVNLAEPENAYEVAKRNVDGVGLLRAEFMIADIGTHPKKMIADGHRSKFIDSLSQGLTSFCQAFYPRPVVYRATDFKTNEYRNLKGGEKYEPIEPNPMLGFRGAYRYIKTPEIFDLELEAIKKVRNKEGLKNLWLMIPFVSTVDELVEVKKLVVTAGLSRSPSFKLWMMVEIPANVILLEDFLNVGIDGVSIGSNDLTMLILGIDRDNSEVAPNFSELNPAVLWALEKTVKTAHRLGVTVGICGQAPSEYPDLVQKLVEWGITSISVNPDAIDRTRDIIAHAEKEHLKSK